MENEVRQKLSTLEIKVDAIYISVEKTRKYFFWTMVVTLALFVVPLIGLVFAIPTFMSGYLGGMNNVMIGL